MKKKTNAVISLLLTVAAVLSMLSLPAAASETTRNYKLQGRLADGSYVVSAYNVKDFGAVGDGKTDDTNAIEAAIEAMLFGSKGGIIYFPAGNYRITRPGFKITNGMTILGETDVLTGNADKGEGSVILCDFDASYTESVFMLSGGSTVSGMSFYYPKQNIESPIAYPAAIAPVGGAAFITLRDIMLYNSYYGIDASGGAQHVANIAGTILHTGINIGANAEVSEFMNIDFNASYWNAYDGTDKTKISAYTKQNATGLNVGYVDEMLAFNVNCPADEFDRGIYFYVEQKMRDMGNSGVAYGNFYKLGDTEVVYEDDYESYYPKGWPRVNILDDVPGSDLYDFSEPDNRYSTKADLFNVCTYGAKGDGTTDDTLAFRDALEAARVNGGGIVFVPAGRYLISGRLEIPQNTELLGEYVGYRHYSPSEIYVNYSGSGEEDYLIGLDDGSGVQGIRFYLPFHNPQSYKLPEGKDYGYKNRKTYDVYNDQFPIEHMNIPSFPYLIRGRGESIWIENVGIINGWNGVDLASEKCNNFTIRSLWGTCMNQGLKIGGGSDGGQISCAWFTYGTWWETISRSIDLSRYAYYGVKAISFGDCSNIRALSAGCFGLSRGLEFIPSQSGAPSNISVLRAVVDMPFGSVGIHLSGGDNISILGAATGLNSLPNINKTAYQIYTASDMNGKVRIYGQNLWSSAKNSLQNDTILYTEDSESADVIDHQFNFGSYLTSFSGSPEPEYDPPEHPEGIELNESVYFDYTKGKEYSYDEENGIITAKPGAALASFLKSANAETGAAEIEYSHDYIKYSYRFLKQYEEVGGGSDWLTYFTFRSTSGYLPMWATDYAAYVVVSRSRMELAVYYDGEKVVSESIYLDPIVEEKDGTFELVDTEWHTVEILINDEERSITVIKDRGTELEDEMTVSTEIDGKNILCSEGGYSHCFYRADMEIGDMTFSSTIPVIEKNPVPETTAPETAASENQEADTAEQAGESVTEALPVAKEGGSALPAVIIAAVVIAAAAVVFAVLKGKKKAS
ncbi:MAG: hypothetical protein IJA85_10210 [Clostridia bacterium]|nr:hypothetical protein [Clostridia bacterium]